MMTHKREFPKEELLALVWGDDPPGYEKIEEQQAGTGRWSSYHSLVFRYEGELWRTHYSVGLTESQDQEPFEYDEPVAYRVEPYEVTVTKYRPIES